MGTDLNSKMAKVTTDGLDLVAKARDARERFVASKTTEAAFEVGIEQAGGPPSDRELLKLRGLDTTCFTDEVPIRVIMRTIGCDNLVRAGLLVAFEKQRRHTVEIQNEYDHLLRESKGMYDNEILPLMEQLSLGGHPTKGKRKKRRAQPSRRDKPGLLERFLAPRPKDRGSGKKGKTAQEEKKIGRALRSNRPTLKLPAYVPPSDVDLREDLVGFVLPMGQGKTTLAREEGWIDFDSLLAPSQKKDLQLDALEAIRRGASIYGAFTPLALKAKETLDLMRPRGTWVVLAPTGKILADLGVRCIGAAVVNPEVATQRNGHREEYEKLLMTKNAEEVMSDEALDVAPLSDYKHVRLHFYNKLAEEGIPVARPCDFVHEDLFTKSDYARSGRFPLDQVIDAHVRGHITVETVNYQLTEHNLKTYQSYGVTPDIWAQNLSLVTSCSSPTGFRDTDWVGKPLSLDSFSSLADVSEHDDVQQLLASHRGEHERFTIALILHWKMIGIHHPLASRLFPLYMIRRVHWSAVWSRLRKCMIGSRKFLDIELTDEEMEEILCMEILPAGSIPDMTHHIQNKHRYHPCPVPSPGDVSAVCKRLSEVEYTTDRYNDKDAKEHLARVMSRSRQEGVSQLIWEMPETGDCDLAATVAYYLGLELCMRWREHQGVDRAIGTIMHKVRSKWYKVGVIKDEWSEMIAFVMDQRLGVELAQAMASGLGCGLEEGSAGEEWGLRVANYLMGVVTCAIVAGQDGKVVFQRNRETGAITPCVLGVDTPTLWLRIARSRIPSHALGLFKSGSTGLRLANELAQWSRSRTVALLEMVNYKSWYQRVSRREACAAMVRWDAVFRSSGSREMVKKMLNVISRDAVGREYESIRTRLYQLETVGGKFGGLGAHVKYSDRAECSTAKDGFWDCHGEIKITRERRRRQPYIPGLVDSFLQPEHGARGETSLAIRLIGPMGVETLAQMGLGRINEHAQLISHMAQ